MKLKLKGFAEVIGEIIPIEKGGYSQVMVLHVPGYKDPLGAWQIRDNYFEIRSYAKEKSNERFISPSLVNNVLEVETVLKGTRYSPKDNPTIQKHFLSLDLLSWKWISKKPADNSGFDGTEVLKEAAGNQLPF
jgi:hypothetical protein